MCAIHEWSAHFFFNFVYMSNSWCTVESYDSRVKFISGNKLIVNPHKKNIMFALLISYELFMICLHSMRHHLLTTYIY